MCQVVAPFPALPEPLVEVLSDFSLHLFVYAHPIRGPTKLQDHLINLLLAMAKGAMYNNRERRLAGEVGEGGL